MARELKLFENHSQYEAYISGSSTILPNVSYCWDDDEVHYNPLHDYSGDYFTIVSLEDNNTISFLATNTSVTKTISASTDNGETWTGFTSSTGTSGTSIVTLNAGENVLIKGENTVYGTSNQANKFKSTKQFDVQGNIMSLLYGDNFVGQTSLSGKDYAFKQLFYENTNIINTENLVLPATTLSSNCYRAMFSACSNLITAPSTLPATTLATSCYQNMFYGTSLITAPKISALTAATSACTQMFYNCSSLTTAPELSATTIATNCYGGMFSFCTGLTTAPSILPATTLEHHCYIGMFQNCGSLTVAPELPARTLANNCYESMFSHCGNLNYIKMLATDISASDCLKEWVFYVASTGTFVKNSAATWTTTGVNGVPSGWTIQTATP